MSAILMCRMWHRPSEFNSHLQTDATRRVR